MSNDNVDDCEDGDHDDNRSSPSGIPPRNQTRRRCWGKDSFDVMSMVENVEEAYGLDFGDDFIRHDDGIFAVGF